MKLYIVYILPQTRIWCSFSSLKFPEYSKRQSLGLLHLLIQVVHNACSVFSNVFNFISKRQRQHTLDILMRLGMYKRVATLRAVSHLTCSLAQWDLWCSASSCNNTTQHPQHSTANTTLSTQHSQLYCSQSCIKKQAIKKFILSIQYI